MFSQIRNIIKFIILVLGVFSITSPAKADEGIKSVISVSTKVVGITADFTGQELTIFGALSDIPKRISEEEQPFQVVVRIRGPKQDIIMRKKARIAGMWLNDAAENLSQMPSYFALLSHKAVNEIGTDIWRKKLGLGLDYGLIQETEFRKKKQGKIDLNSDFVQAYIRLKKNDGLFFENDTALRFLSPTVFRADIELPANVPVGIYRADLYVFDGEKLISSSFDSFSVSKAGLEKQITRFAIDYSLFYGIAAVFMAIFAGWLANYVMRS